MPATVVGQIASNLDWLGPNAASLTALVRRQGEELWNAIRTDPGCLLLALRETEDGPALADYSRFLFQDVRVLDKAVCFLESDPGYFADWNDTERRAVYRACMRYAECARRLAQESGDVQPGLAWLAGLLAPLGWLAVSTVAPGVAATCLADPDHVKNAAAAERRHWGLDQAAIGRRLARRWRLPPWLGAIVGHLGLSVDLALPWGADAKLFQLTQLAAALVDKENQGLDLPVGSSLQSLYEAFPSIKDPQLMGQAVLVEPLQSPPSWTPPHTLPLLCDLLKLSATTRRLQAPPSIESLETGLDLLHQALAEQRQSEDRRLNELKLNTLAEFAAGAGHEINNPLAVISGQAQYLLGLEENPDLQKALQKIIGQTQRIHEILTQLMQFARPAPPQKRGVDVGRLLREATLSLQDLAAGRQVQLICPDQEAPQRVLGDPKQLRIALTCLLRNAIEAAPAQGWASVRCLASAEHQLDIMVEDNGPGFTVAQREHMFDPFYSGRPAGRGRGLGLPTAWRLARENGGDVFLDEDSDGPTRFILRLPRSAYPFASRSSVCTAGGHSPNQSCRTAPCDNSAMSSAD